MLAPDDIVGLLDYWKYFLVVHPQVKEADLVSVYNIDKPMYQQLVKYEPRSRVNETGAMIKAAVFDYFVTKYQTHATVPLNHIKSVLTRFASLFPDVASHLPTEAEVKTRLQNVDRNPVTGVNRERDRIVLLFRGSYEPKDVFWFLEFTIVHNPRSFTFLVAGNMAALEFLHPLVVSNCPIRLALYHPKGLNNSYTMSTYLKNLDKVLGARRRKIMLICHSNVIVDVKLKNIEIVYVLLTCDPFISVKPKLMSLPGEYGVVNYIKQLLYSQLAKLLTFPDDIVLDQLLLAYHQLTRRLNKAEGLYFYQLNIMKLAWLGGNPLDVKLHNDKVGTDGDGFFLKSQPVSPSLKQIADYHYLIKDLYYIVACYQNYSIPLKNLRLLLLEICSYLSSHVHPYLAENLPEVVGPLNQFMSSLLNHVRPGYEMSIADEKFVVVNPAHIEPVAELVKEEQKVVPVKVPTNVRSNLFNRESDERIESSTYIQLRLPPDINVVAKKRSADEVVDDEADDEQQSTVKKIRVVENALISRLPFISREGFSDDDDEGNDHDSFDDIALTQIKKRQISKSLNVPDLDNQLSNVAQSTPRSPAATRQAKAKETNNDLTKAMPTSPLSNKHPSPSPNDPLDEARATRSRNSASTQQQQQAPDESPATPPRKQLPSSTLNELNEPALPNVLPDMSPSPSPSGDDRLPDLLPDEMSLDQDIEEIEISSSEDEDDAVSESGSEVGSEVVSSEEESDDDDGDHTTIHHPKLSPKLTQPKPTQSKTQPKPAQPKPVANGRDGLVEPDSDLSDGVEESDSSDDDDDKPVRQKVPLTQPAPAVTTKATPAKSTPASRSQPIPKPTEVATPTPKASTQTKPKEPVSAKAATQTKPKEPVTTKAALKEPSPSNPKQKQPSPPAASSTKKPHADDTTEHVAKRAKTLPPAPSQPKSTPATNKAIPAVVKGTPTTAKVTPTTATKAKSPETPSVVKKAPAAKATPAAAAKAKSPDAPLVAKPATKVTATPASSAKDKQPVAKGDAKPDNESSSSSSDDDLSLSSSGSSSSSSGDSSSSELGSDDESGSDSGSSSGSSDSELGSGSSSSSDSDSDSDSDSGSDSLDSLDSSEGELDSNEKLVKLLKENKDKATPASTSKAPASTKATATKSPLPLTKLPPKKLPTKKLPSPPKSAAATPAKASATPAKATPAKATPAKSAATPAKATPAKASATPTLAVPSLKKPLATVTSPVAEKDTTARSPKAAIKFKPKIVARPASQTSTPTTARTTQLPHAASQPASAPATATKPKPSPAAMLKQLPKIIKPQLASLSSKVIPSTTIETTAKQQPQQPKKSIIEISSDTSDSDDNSD